MCHRPAGPPARLPECGTAWAAPERDQGTPGDDLILLTFRANLCTPSSAGLQSPLVYQLLGGSCLLQREQDSICSPSPALDSAQRCSLFPGGVKASQDSDTKGWKSALPSPRFKACRNTLISSIAVAGAQSPHSTPPKQRQLSLSCAP